MDDFKILDLLDKADEHIRKNETEEGKRIYQEIIDLAQTPVLKLRNLGLIYQSQGLYDKAIDKYKEALKLDEDCNLIHLRMGEIYAMERKFNEAIFHYKRSLDSSSYDELSGTCDFCGGSENEIVTVRNLKLSGLQTYGGINPLRIWVRCSNCGLVYVNPRPSKESLKKFYEAHPQSDEFGIQKTYLNRLSFLINLSSERLRIIEGYILKKGKLLDVGAV